MVNYRWATPTNDKDSINGWVVHIDHFGNLITNISRDLYNQSLAGRNCKIYVGNTIIHGLSSTFNSAPDGEAVAVTGSTGMIEVGINKGNAQQMLGVEKGAPVTILFKS
jgi:S-adenosylmethionine hydrolase